MDILKDVRKEVDDRIQIREHGDMVRWGANILSLNVIS